MSVRILSRRALLAIAALACLSASGPASAADKISIMVGGLEKQIYLPAMLTEKLGNFKTEGLNVELLNSGAGVEAENELLSGGVQGVVGFYDHTIDIQSKGRELISIVQFSQAPGEVELISSELAGQIRFPAQLRGLTLGITALGSSTEFLSRYIAVSGGLPPGTYDLLGVGAGTTFITAMHQRKIAAGMTTEPTVGQMLKRGEARILIDMRTPASTRAVLGGTYPGASFYVQADWLAAHQEEAQKLANAFVRTLHWMASHSAAEIAEQMPKDYYVGDKDLYVKGLADGKAQFTVDGRMPPDGPFTALKVLRTFSRSMQGKQIDLAKTWTPQYVDAAAKQVAAN